MTLELLQDVPLGTTTQTLGAIRMLWLQGSVIVSNCPTHLYPEQSIDIKGLCVEGRRHHLYPSDPFL
jgi:hypothetical protein